MVLSGVTTRAGSGVPGMDSETYIRESILDPADFNVVDYPDGIMPESLKEDLTEENLDAVVAYLLTLR